MSAVVLLVVLVLIAALAPWFGADSRGLTDQVGSPPDLMASPPDPRQLVEELVCHSRTK